jgi:type IV secretion system protein VirB10
VVNEPEQAQSSQSAGPGAELRLRSERPPVMRLSRKVLTGLAGVAAITVTGALIWALYQGNRKSGGGPELYNTETKTTPEGLSTLPRDYAGVSQNTPPLAGVPPLGAPLPGDIGRPVLSPQAPGPGAVDPEQQRIAQESEAARTSRLFATTSTRERPAAAVPPLGDQKTATPTGQADAPPLDPESLLNMQDRKSAFLNGAVDRKTVSLDLENPPSRYVVQAGVVIAAALITGIRSDLPGQVTAQVTENVYDSPSGRFLLIPTGIEARRRLRQRDLLRPGSRTPGLDATDHAERPFHRAGAPARRRHSGLHQP